MQARLLAYIGLGFTLLTAHAAQATPNCAKLLGTWQADYKIINEFTDVFIINTVKANGAVFGQNRDGTTLSGYCKNGVVMLRENYRSDFLNAYYFVNGKPSFGQYNIIFQNTDPAYLLGYYSIPSFAAIKKISNVTSPIMAKAKYKHTVQDHRKWVEHLKKQPQGHALQLR
jgi:hypothetical protein